MLKAVIFDLDNTLYDYDAAHAVAWDSLRAFAAGALRVTPEQFDALHAAADRVLRERTGGGCAAIHNRLLRYQMLLELIHKPVGLAPEMAKLYWTALLAIPQIEYRRDPKAYFLITEDYEAYKEYMASKQSASKKRK